MKLKRMTAALLLLAMLLSWFAARRAGSGRRSRSKRRIPWTPRLRRRSSRKKPKFPRQQVNASGYFYFSAETANKLLIAPTRIAFTDGQTSAKR